MRRSEMEKFAKSWIGVLVATLLAAVILGAFESKVGSQAGFAVIFIGYVSAILTLVVGVAVHEAGHLFVGVSLGLRCRSVLIGPLQWIREKDRWAFSLTNDARMSGMVTFDPYRSEALKKKYLVMFAAGPIASLLFALLLTPFIYNLDFPGVVLWPLAQMTALAFLWLMVINFVPIKFSGFGTDGYWILAIVTGNKSALGMAALNRVAADVKDGKHESEWDEEDVRAMGEVESPLNLVVVARALLFWHALAKGETAQAREHIIESLKAIHKMKANVVGLRFTTFASAAFSAAMIDGDAEIVKEFIGEIDYTPPEGKGMLTQINSWLARQEGREEDALELAERSVREVVEWHPGKMATIWSHVDNYRFIGEAEYARAVATAEELIGPQLVPPLA